MTLTLDYSELGTAGGRDLGYSEYRGSPKTRSTPSPTPPTTTSGSTSTR